MEPLLPATEQLFASQRQQQQHFVRTAEIQKTLRQTTVYALAALDKLAQRGETLDEQSVQADAVEASSLAMALHVQRENEARTWWGWLKGLMCGCFPKPTMTLITPTASKTPEHKEGRRSIYFVKK